MPCRCPGPRNTFVVWGNRGPGPNLIDTDRLERRARRMMGSAQMRHLTRLEPCRPPGPPHPSRSVPVGRADWIVPLDQTSNRLGLMVRRRAIAGAACVHLAAMRAVSNHGSKFGLAAILRDALAIARPKGR